MGSKLNPRVTDLQREKNKITNEAAQYFDAYKIRQGRVKELEQVLKEERALPMTTLADEVPLFRQHETQPDCTHLIIPARMAIRMKDYDSLVSRATCTGWKSASEDNLRNWCSEATGEHIERGGDTVSNIEVTENEFNDASVSQWDMAANEVTRWTDGVCTSEWETAGSAVTGGLTLKRERSGALAEVPSEHLHGGPSAEATQSSESQISYTQPAYSSAGTESVGWRSKKGAEKYCRRVRNGNNSRR